MSTTAPKPTWYNGKLPANTAVFTLGDIHGHAKMLGLMLEEIEEKIAALPKGTKVHVIGIGDYIDRGESAPETIKLLQHFKTHMAQKNPLVQTHLLCGNHDLCFKYLLDATRITDKTDGDVNDPKDRRHHLLMADGSLPLGGLIDWMDSGGGITTIKNYCPNLKEGFIERCRAGNNLDEVNAVIDEMKRNMPQAHKDFFRDVSENTHLIVGDFLYTHAGIDPTQSLEAQGLTHGKVLAPLDKMQMVDPLNRNSFLWRDQLDHCPYVVVHGHTPSVVETTDGKDKPIMMVDPQQPYRLCVDTGIYNPKGALSCTIQHGDRINVLAVNRDDPTYVSGYTLTPETMGYAREQHAAKYPQYHNIVGGGTEYYGPKSVGMARSA